MSHRTELMIAQISDLHAMPEGALFRDAFDANAHIARAVARINALSPRPDMVVISGDLANTGAPEEYDALMARLSALEPPVIAFPGNHDDPDAVERLFPEVNGPRPGERCFFLHDLPPLRFVALDSCVPGETAGELGRDQLIWLSEILVRDPNTPLLIGVHHPPISTGITFMDPIGLKDGQTLAGLLAKAPNVLAVLSGHIHRFSVGLCGSVPAITAPSTGFSFQAEFAPVQKPHWTKEPPGLLIHLWREGAGLVTHQIFLDDGAPAA